MNSTDASTYVRMFEDAESATQRARAEAERDRDYYDGRQWTDAEREALKKRGQPCITINRIKRKIDFLRGVEVQQRSDPKAFPRTPADEDAAAAATDALRYVADANRYPQTRSAVWDNLLVEGYGGAEIVVEYRPPTPADRSQQGDVPEVIIRHIPWDRLFYDPHSRQPDFSDARYLGLVLWLDQDEADERYPDAKEIIAGTIDQASDSRTYDDRPAWTVWADGTRRRVRVVQMWHIKDGKWQWCDFTKAGVLASGESPYKDDYGKPACPLILTSAYIDRDNDRYGVVRELVSPQDEINKRRSKMLHLLSVRQTFGNKDAIKDADAARRQLARPDGHVEIEAGQFGQDFGVLPTGDMARGQYELMVHATQEIDLMGPNAAMSGKSEKQQSGRAILAQQQGGYVELGPLTDRLRDFNQRVYRAIWQRIRQFWDQERWVRITDDERNVRFVGFNKPVTAIEAAQKQLAQSGMPPDQMQATLAQLQADPRAGMQVGVENVPAEMWVDIVVDDAPDSVMIQQEQFEQLVQLAPTMQAENIPVAKLLIEASQLRNKQKLLEMLDGPKNDPQAQQMQQAQQELQLRGAVANVRAVEARAAKDEASATKTMAEAQRGPEAPQGPSELEQAQAVADIRHTNAKADQVQADALRTMAELQNPMPVIPPA